jgi:hypothetical protein
VRHSRHSDPGSDRGSPWTSRKSAGATLGEDAGAGLAQQPPAVDGGRGQGVIGLQPGGDQRLTLPGELVGPQPAAAEVGPGAKQHPRGMGEPDRLMRRRPPLGQPRPPSAEAKAASRVVAPKLAQDSSTARVATRAVPSGGHDPGQVGLQPEPVLQGIHPAATPARAPGSSELWRSPWPRGHGPPRRCGGPRRR